MKKMILALALLVLALVVNVNAVENIGYGNINATLFKYDPVLAPPGGQVDLWFNIESTGNQPAVNTTTFLDLVYPFYFDAGETAVQYIGEVPSGKTIMVPYRIRVRGDAVAGTYSIILRYSQQMVTKEKSVSIKVDEIATDFDVAVQEMTGDELPIAISNIGKNNANAVTVRTYSPIEYANIMGNLNAGDYTVVSIPWVTMNNATSRRLVRGVVQNVNAESPKSVQLEISYTDYNGNRRTVLKNVSLASAFLSSNPSAIPLTAPGFGDRNNNFNPWFYATIVLLVLIIGYVVYVRILRRGKPKEE